MFRVGAFFRVLPGVLKDTLTHHNVSILLNEFVRRCHLDHTWTSVDCIHLYTSLYVHIYIYIYNLFIRFKTEATTVNQKNFASNRCMHTCSLMPMVRQVLCSSQLNTKCWTKTAW